MKYLIIVCTLFLFSCGKDTAVTIPVETNTEPDVVDVPKKDCYKFYRYHKKRRMRLCRFLYIKDVRELNCKCRYRRR